MNQICSLCLHLRDNQSHPFGNSDKMVSSLQNNNNNKNYPCVCICAYQQVFAKKCVPGRPEKEIWEDQIRNDLNLPVMTAERVTREREVIHWQQ